MMVLRHYELIASECPDFFAEQSVTVESVAADVNCPACLARMESSGTLVNKPDLTVLRHYEPIARECLDFFAGQSVTVESVAGDVNCPACLARMESGEVH